MVSKVSPTAADSQLVRRLAPRIGLYHLNQRLQRENDKGDTFSRRNLDEWLPIAPLVRAFVAVTGIRARGERNAASPVLTRHTIGSPRLPDAFDGYRILHLTDLHFDGEVDFVEVLRHRLSSLHYDLCVLTGDFREGFRDSPRLQEQLRTLRELITTEAYGVLGNHDSIAMVPWMEDMGYRLLLNESDRVEYRGEHINVVGVDDYHYFRCANIEKAMSGIEAGFTLMLNHSPEQFRQAAYAGVDAYLCGHTHGGQLCLPGGWPPNLNLECTRKVGSGPWSFGNMIGYTSRGVGTSLVPVRFNCFPEIVLHELRRV